MNQEKEKIYRYRILPIKIITGNSEAFQMPNQSVSSKESQSVYRALLNDGFRCKQIDGGNALFEKSFDKKPKKKEK